MIPRPTKPICVVPGVAGIFDLLVQVEAVSTVLGVGVLVDLRIRSGTAGI
jgi:hypothetical protein